VNIWFYGSTGTGKSYTARQEFPDAFLKSADTKWWCGYNYEDNVIIEDFDKYHVKQGFHLKIWADRYAFPCEEKGSANRIRPKRIAVTSNYHPIDIWDDKCTYEPLLRRFKVVYIGNEDPVHRVDEIRRPWNFHQMASEGDASIISLFNEPGTSGSFVSGFVAPKPACPVCLHSNDECICKNVAFDSDVGCDSPIEDRKQREEIRERLCNVENMVYNLKEKW